MYNHYHKVILSMFVALLAPAFSQASDWPQYGGNLQGQRYAANSDITPKNVTQLKRAWMFRTGDHTDGKDYFGQPSNFKATPILFDQKIIFPTGFNRVIAIDPTNGEEFWRFDPGVDFSTRYSEMFTSRGVASWEDPKAGARQVCKKRIYFGTLDARLFAIDAKTGKACQAFGNKGQINLAEDIERYRHGNYSMTSPPLVVNETIIAGSSIGDNGAANLESGVVRAFDARTGKPKWQFDPIHYPEEPDQNFSTGAANVWSIMSADTEAGMVYLPTTSPSPDFYGGMRLGDNHSANSIVALDIDTGRVIWSYQIVRHDLWDYDLASQPLLIDLHRGEQIVPALVLATKTGFLYVFNRRTGKPVFPIEELTVPASDVAGEDALSSQPVSSISLHPRPTKIPKLWARDDAHLEGCKKMLEGVRFEGMFTPPSLEGTLLYPGNAGGVNWGSLAVHTKAQKVYVAVNRLPTVVKLFPRKQFLQARQTGTINGVEAQFTEQAETPYGMGRYELFNRTTNAHCLEGPWSTLVAVDLNDGTIEWESPAGQAPNVDADSPTAHWGFFANGGPLVTTGGVIFLATQYDHALTAYDASNGHRIWQASLPAGPHATPMAYTINDSSYIVITAGGNLVEGTGRGDYVIAYRLNSSLDVSQ